MSSDEASREHEPRGLSKLLQRFGRPSQVQGTVKAPGVGEVSYTVPSPFGPTESEIRDQVHQEELRHLLERHVRATEELKGEVAGVKDELKRLNNNIEHTREGEIMIIESIPPQLRLPSEAHDPDRSEE